MSILVVYTDDPDRCVEELEPVLTANTSGFDFVEAASAPDGNTSLEYLVVLSKSVSGAALVSRVRQQVTEFLVAAEFRVIDRKSLKK